MLPDLGSQCGFLNGRRELVELCRDGVAVPVVHQAGEQVETEVVVEVGLHGIGHGALHLVGYRPALLFRTGRVEPFHDLVLPFVDLRVVVVGLGAGDLQRFVFSALHGDLARFEEDHRQRLVLVAEQAERRFVGSALEGEPAVGNGRFGDVLAFVVHERNGAGEARNVAGDGVAVLLTATAEHHGHGCDQ